MKIELYYYEQCPFCHMVTSKISDLGLDQSIEFKNTLESAEHRDFHQKKTGRTTVPCLYIDGNPLFESRDIMTWLETNREKIKK
jgi:glutaredoxin